MAELKWQREPPHSPGHWVWAEIENGLILQSGTFCVPPIPAGAELKWVPPLKATVWAKIELPPREWVE